MLLLEEAEVSQPGTGSFPLPAPGLAGGQASGWEQGARITPSSILESTGMDFSSNCLSSDCTARLCPDCVIFPQASLDSVVVFWHKDFAALSLLSEVGSSCSALVWNPSLKNAGTGFAVNFIIGQH